MFETIGGAGWSKDAGNVSDDEYATYLAGMQMNFDKYTAHASALFTVEIEGRDPWATWIDQFIGEERQFHNCNACKSFIKHYGTLAIVMQNGELRSPIWVVNEAPPLYQPSVHAMARAVERGRIVAPFRRATAPLGVEVTGQWRHLSLTLPRVHLHARADITAEQYSAEKRQDFHNVRRALKEYDLDTMNKVVALLEADDLTRSEKFLAPAKWLRDLQLRARAYHPHMDGWHENLVWLAVAQAGPGFCHPRSGMLSTLFDDLSSGMAFEDVRARWTAKLHPLKYQRATAAPDAGTVLQAQALFSKLELETALERRYAVVDEIKAIWRRRDSDLPAGVFSSLMPQNSRLEVPGLKTMSWVKFARDVLPIATSIKVGIPAKGAFGAFVAPVHFDSGRLFQWDGEDQEERNQFSWYLVEDGYGTGSSPSKWGLVGGTWGDVEALSPIPPLWGSHPIEQWGKQVLFVIKGARPAPVGSACLFPETLRSELHGVRSVIEAYSKTRRVEGAEQASAVGLLMNEHCQHTRLKVTSKHLTGNYIIDRWE